MTVLCTESLCGEQFNEPQGRRLTDHVLGPQHRRAPAAVTDGDGLEAAADRPRLGELPRRRRQRQPVQVRAHAGRQSTATTRRSRSGSPARTSRSSALELGRDVVDTMRPGGDKPGFWMVHYVEPHVPWRFLPDGRQYPVVGPSIPGLDDQDWGDDEFLLDQAYQRHFLQAALRRPPARRRDRRDEGERPVGRGARASSPPTTASPSARAVAPPDHRRTTSATSPASRCSSSSRARTTARSTTSSSPRSTSCRRSSRRSASTPTRSSTASRSTSRATRRRSPIRNGRAGELVSVPPEAFLRQPRRRARRPPRAHPAGRVSTIGPRLDLVGKPVTDLDIADGGDAGAFLNNRRLYKRVKRKSGVLPVYLTGSTQNVEAGTDLVVADQRHASRATRRGLRPRREPPLLDDRPAARAISARRQRRAHLRRRRGPSARQLYGKS